METQNTKLNSCCGEYRNREGFIYCPECGETLQDDKVKDKDVLAAKDKELAEIKGQYEKLKEEFEKLKAKENKQVVQNAIDDACKKVQEKADKTIEELQNKINVLEKEKKAEETTTRINELNKTIENKTKEINRLIIDVTNREDDIKRLKEQISGSVSIDDKEKQIKELNSKFVEKEAKYKVYIKIMLIAISVVSMLAIVSFVIMISSAPEDKPGGLMTVSFSNVIDNLEGSYTMLKTHNGHIVSDNVSIIITGNGMGKYKIEQHDQANSPDSCYFSIGQNAVLNSSDIGIGDIKYTKNGKHNKINLEFKKDNTVWKFTKR